MANKNKLSYKNVIETLQRQKNEHPICLLNNLKYALSESTSKQWYPFVPIRIVGIIEGFCTQQYQFIIDAGASYRERLFKLLNINDMKFDAVLINRLIEGAVTFGEYASFLISCNNIQDIFNSFSVLLNTNDFESQFSDKVKNDIENVFRTRHMFCHEMVDSPNLTFDLMIQWIDSAIEFITKMSNKVLSVIYPNSPKTQTDMNIQVTIDIAAADKKLQALLNKLKKITVDIPLFPNLDFMDVFKQYRIERAKIEYLSFIDGSIYPLLVGQSILETTNELIDTLNRKYRIYLRENVQ